MKMEEQEMNMLREIVDTIVRNRVQVLTTMSDSHTGILAVLKTAIDRLQVAQKDLEMRVVAHAVDLNRINGLEKNVATCRREIEKLKDDTHPCEEPKPESVDPFEPLTLPEKNGLWHEYTVFAADMSRKYRRDLHLIQEELKRTVIGPPGLSTYGPVSTPNCAQTKEGGEEKGEDTGETVEQFMHRWLEFEAPSRAGLKWSPQEDEELVQAVIKFLYMQAVIKFLYMQAFNMKRTVGGVSARIQVAMRTIREGGRI